MLLTKFNFTDFHSNIAKDMEYVTKFLNHNNYLLMAFLKFITDRIKLDEKEIKLVNIFYFAYDTSFEKDKEYYPNHALNFLSYLLEGENGRYPFYLYEVIIRKKRYIIIANSLYTRLLSPKLFMKLKIFKNKLNKELKIDDNLENYILELMYLNNINDNRELFKKLFSCNNNVYKDIKKIESN